MGRLLLTEKDLERAVAEMARYLGFMVFHARPAQTRAGWVTPVAYDGKGYPDLTLVGNGRVVFLEIKSATGRLSPDQGEWKRKIIDAGQEWFLVTPKSWTSGEVDKILGTSTRPLASPAAGLVSPPTSSGASS